MAKVLGLDLGTNSLGWALADEYEQGYALLDKGVEIFQEGVARDKNNEKPAVQDRTDARALRRHYFRRRLRKIDLLRVLVRYDLCPPLTEEQLSTWRQKKQYPLDEEFLRWQRTDDNEDRNPYHDRYVALTERLDLENRAQRWLLGRAFYHLAQRRGFLSNRKEAGNEKEDGTVKESIKNLSAEMEAAGCRYLGEYFYGLYQHKERIRGKYTSRNEHYLAEFNAICDRQQLPDKWRRALHRAIFFQRDLKSQKGSVGRCTFEPTKSRCPVSHPRFEEFRMWSFINNIRVTGPDDGRPRPLTPKEIETIRPLFFRKSKSYFDFEEIARRIAGKGKYACREERIEAPYRFNFARTTTVSGCPVTASLMDIFGKEWLREIRSLYLLGDGKTEEQVLNDIWHALFSFKDEERLRDWACEKLQFSEEQAKAFAAIKLPQDYAAMSLNAINKILPICVAAIGMTKQFSWPTCARHSQRRSTQTRIADTTSSRTSPRCCSTTSGIRMTNSIRRSVASPTTSATTDSICPVWTGCTIPRKSRPTRMQSPMPKESCSSDPRGHRPSATRWPCGRCSGCAT